MAWGTAEELDTAWYRVPAVLATVTVMGDDVTIRPLESWTLLASVWLPSKEGRVGCSVFS